MLKDITNALDESPVATFHFHLAQVQLAVGKKQLAEQAFREAQDLDPVTDLHVLETTDYQKMAEMFR